MTDSVIKKQVKHYIEDHLPSLSVWEKEKLTKDWIGKEYASEGVALDFIKRAGNPKGKRVFELGFGNGFQVIALSKKEALVSGVEISETLLQIASQNLKEKNILADLKLYNGVNIPYPDNYFDFAIATSVLEHVTHLTPVLKEVVRILSPGGKFYVSFPNRLWLKETHTGIWFLNQIPKFLGKRLLKFLHRGSMEDWNLHFLSFWKIKRILKEENIPFSVIYETESPSFIRRFLKKMLQIMDIHHSAFLRTVMIILEKNRE